MVTLPERPEDLAELRYSDLQSLAADHGYGRIVGVAREDLVGYLAEEAYPRPDVVDGDQDDVVEPDQQRVDQQPADQDDVDRALGSDSADSASATSDGQREQRADGAGAVEQTDSIEVGHEGKEKLSPEGAPDNDKAAVEPPEDVDLGDAGMDDIEPDPEVASRATSASSESATVDGDQEAVDEDSGDDGPLSKLRGDSEKTSEEIVEDADDPEERQRRDEMRNKLKEAMSGKASPSSDSGADSAGGESADSAGSDSAGSAASAPAGARRANGVVMDESVVGALMELPFNTASAATGWDGWELSESEREANAELFIAMCDEHDVELSAATMFALSIGGQMSGRFMRYKRSTADSDGVDAVDDDPETASSEQRAQRADGGEQRRQQRQQQRTDSETDASDSEEFDFHDSSTW